MDTLQTIAKRRSIRAFKDNQIPEEILMKILEAARAAPSAGNRQARDIIVIDNGEIKKILTEAAFGQEFIEEAPIVLVFCAVRERSARRYGDRGRNLYCILDAAASAENVLLAAHALGLGTCWIGAFNDDMVAETLGLPSDARPIALIPVGYPAEKPDETPRLVFKEFIHLNQYGRQWRD
jgi:nitroreductase